MAKFIGFLVFTLLILYISYTFHPFLEAYSSHVKLINNEKWRQAECSNRDFVEKMIILKSDFCNPITSENIQLSPFYFALYESFPLKNDLLYLKASLNISNTFTIQTFHEIKQKFFFTFYLLFFVFSITYLFYIIILWFYKKIKNKFN